MIRLRDVTVAYGDKVILDNINLDIHQGETLAVLGASGSGKSTILRLIIGLQKPTKGHVFFQDTDITAYDEDQLMEVRRHMGMVFQYSALFDSMTVGENVAFGLRQHTHDDAATRQRIVKEKLHLVGLDGIEDMMPNNLSGGMKRRFGIAQALLNDPKILIIDEPTAGLDPEERLRFYNLLSELAVERIILLSTHIASDIEATCSKAAVLSSGTVVFEGQIEKLLQPGNGKVYTTTILQNELNQFKQKYRVISIHQNGINVSCRFLSNAAQKKEWVSCQPTIEDSYMYLLSSFKQGVE